MSRQSHQHSIVCYHENTISIIAKIPQFEHVTYILHDSDFNSDGSAKTPHYHVLFRSKSSKTSSAVQKIINNELVKIDPNYFDRPIHDSIFCEFVRDTVSIIDYLTHKNDKTKYQYADELIVGDIQWWLSNSNDLSAECSRDKTDWTIALMGLIRDEHYILRSDVLMLATEYGRDFLLNFPRVLQSFREIYRCVFVVDKLPQVSVSRETFDENGRPCLIDTNGELIFADRSIDSTSPF